MDLKDIIYFSEFIENGDSKIEIIYRDGSIKVIDYTPDNVEELVSGMLQVKKVELHDNDIKTTYEDNSIITFVNRHDVELRLKWIAEKHDAIVFRTDTFDGNDKDNDKDNDGMLVPPTGFDEESEENLDEESEEELDEEDKKNKRKDKGKNKKEKKGEKEKKSREERKAERKAKKEAKKKRPLIDKILILVLAALIGVGVYHLIIKPAIFKNQNKLKIIETNPYNNQNTTIHMERNATVEGMMGAINVNSLMNNFTKNMYYQLTPYFEDTEDYYNPEEIYNILGTSDLNFESQGTLVDAKSARQIFKTLGSLEANGVGSSLTEGMIANLASEYYDAPTLGLKYSKEGQYNVGLVNQKVNAVLCKLVGSETMIQAFTTKNQQLIISALTNIYGDEAAAIALIKGLDGLNSGDLLNDGKAAATLLTPYINAMENDEEKLKAILYSQELGDQTKGSVYESLYNDQNNGTREPAVVFRNLDGDNVHALEVDYLSESQSPITNVLKFSDLKDVNPIISSLQNGQTLDGNTDTKGISR